jgi:hypothetical protein
VKRTWEKESDDIWCGHGLGIRSESVPKANDDKKTKKKKKI